MSRTDDEFLPGVTVQGTFNDAVNGQSSAQQEQGDGSKMVKEDAPKPEYRPPQEMAEAQDRKTHFEKMAQDGAMTASYYEKLEERLENAALEREAMGQNQAQDYSQDYDHS